MEPTETGDLSGGREMQSGGVGCGSGGGRSRRKPAKAARLADLRGGARQEPWFGWPQPNTIRGAAGFSRAGCLPSRGDRARAQSFVHLAPATGAARPAARRMRSAEASRATSITAARAIRLTPAYGRAATPRKCGRARCTAREGARGRQTLQTSLSPGEHERGPNRPGRRRRASDRIRVPGYSSGGRAIRLSGIGGIWRCRGKR